MSCDVNALSNIDVDDVEQASDLMQQCTAVLTDPMLWFWAIVFTIVCAGVGALIGRYKNTVVRDAMLGAALGPIGWIVSLLLPKPVPKPVCPQCKRVVDAADAHCRHCGARLKPIALR